MTDKMTAGEATAKATEPERHGRLLIVDDDGPFRNRLGRAMEKHGFEVDLASERDEALTAARTQTPEYAVVDMRLGEENGLELVTELRALAPKMRIVVLTGYGNIASAVAAVKSGAVDYLAKPADADAVAAALLSRSDESPPLPEKPMSADRVRWEHIQRVYEMCGRNVSETARRLNMHRRTLQRILAKRAPR